MTAKEYLSQAYKLDREADMILQKADALRKSLYGRGQNYENTGHNSNNDGIAKAIEKVADYERKADKVIDKLVDMRIEIENAIAEIPDPIQREVLERRYLMYQPFEGSYDKKTGVYIKGIDESMGYSTRQIYRFHGYGLQKIKKDVSECQ